MLGPAGKVGGLYDHVAEWAKKNDLLDEPDVRRALGGEIRATFRLNELLNWQVAASESDAVDIADASATKVFATERIQRVGRLAEEIVGRHGDPADPGTGELLSWLDMQIKRNLVITFGGGVNEVMRELIATAGLGMPPGSAVREELPMAIPDEILAAAERVRGDGRRSPPAPDAIR